MDKKCLGQASSFKEEHQAQPVPNPLTLNKREEIDFSSFMTSSCTEKEEKNRKKIVRMKQTLPLPCQADCTKQYKEKKKRKKKAVTTLFKHSFKLACNAHLDCERLYQGKICSLFLPCVTVFGGGTQNK